MSFPRRPPARPKLGEEVARSLRDALMAGVYPPNSRMGVEELAEQLQVSTMPVREALITLANEGLLEGLPRRGFRVAEIGLRDIEDVFKVHAFLAGLLAERATQVITREDLAKLRELETQIEQISSGTGSAEEIEELNFQFHRIINKTADSKRLEWFLRAATRFVPRRFYEAIPGWIEESVHQHPPIMAALETRDAAEAKRLMEQHVTDAGRLVISHLESAGWTRNLQAS
jgi:DNA-binding GntR family transcriptional regulator